MRAATMRCGLILAATAAAMLAGAPRAWAYRPFTGTDADIVEPKAIELEIGPVGYLRSQSRSTLVAPSLIANWGFARDLELVAEGRQLIPLEPAPGEARLQIVETQLDLKWVMREGSLQGREGPSVASEWTILLPETGQSRSASRPPPSCRCDGRR